MMMTERGDAGRYAAVDEVVSRTLAQLRSRRRFPGSTYRIQFHKGFTFRDATAIVPYVQALGVTHLYASPYLRATPGSTHGYDVVDHTRLNDELGTRADYDAWLAAMRAAGIGHILDVVPNHMGVGSNENALWNDLLENGRTGKHGEFFDVAWQSSPRPELRDRVLISCLGAPFGTVLEKGELKLRADADKFYVAYYDRRFPISPATYDAIFSGARPDEAAIAARLVELNGTVGDPLSFAALEALLDRQHYRLAYWRTASDEINYRRFFDVDSLAALAMERSDVFDEAHALILDLAVSGHIDGFRIDHSDGLFDPQEYFVRLQRAFVEVAAARELAKDGALPPAQRDHLRERIAAAMPDVGPNDDLPLYVVTEKILAPGEPLPREWAMHGTSGYDILNEINGLFVDPSGQPTLDKCYRAFVGADAPADYHELAYEQKRGVLRRSFASELNPLAHQLDRLAQQDRHTRDFTLDVLRDALCEVVATFSVYRSYVTHVGASARDVEVITNAIDKAIEREPTIEACVFHFIRDALLLRGRYGEDLRDAAVRFAMTFQQLTSPVTAKGLEDTAFYIYHRLNALNEVGGEPSRFGVDAKSLHETFIARQRDWPRAMSVLSTHDTKRAEDVRARLSVLSEIADEWAAAVGEWHAINAPDGVHPNDEYLLYQTLIGAWPTGAVDATFVDRIVAYMNKAMREAKQRTSWTAPNTNIETAVEAFIRRVLDDTRGATFRSAFETTQQRVERAGRVNSLAQTLLRLTAPGIPDTYQGTELWDLSLVDPDNRRPVDYPQRASLLNGLTAAPPCDDTDALGTSKLWITTTALRLRRDRATLFADGSYEPLSVTGQLAKHVFAFARRTAGAAAIVIVPRCVTTLIDDRGALPANAWGDTTIVLPAGLAGDRFRCQLNDVAVNVADGRVALRSLFTRLPVALITD